MPKGRFAKDLTGQTFGLLTVARRAPNYISKTGQEAVWHCRCECGNELDVRAGQLRSGHTKSCGCFQKKAAAKSSTVHGGAATKLYGVWSSMKHRCTNPHDKRFKDYGGRGITEGAGLRSARNGCTTFPPFRPGHFLTDTKKGSQ